MSKFKEGDWVVNSLGGANLQVVKHVTSIMSNQVTLFAITENNLTKYTLWEPKYDEIICFISAEGNVLIGNFKEELPDGEYVGMHLDGVHLMYVDDIAPLEFAITLREE